MHAKYPSSYSLENKWRWPKSDILKNDSLKFRFLSHFAQWLNINKSVVLSLMPSESGVSNKFSWDDQVTVSVVL